MADTRDVTDQILSAWEDDSDDAEETPEEEVEVGTAETIDEGEADAVESEPEDGDNDADDDGEDGEGSEEEGEGTAEDGDGDGDASDSQEEDDPVLAALLERFGDDPVVNAYLAKYRGDPLEAFKGAANLELYVGRLGEEKRFMQVRLDELENTLKRERAFGNNSVVLSEEQRQWVEQAAASGNPRGYIQAAVNEGEFDVARAVCEAIAEDYPYDAARLANYIDQNEAWNTQQQMQEAANVQIDHGVLMDVLVQHFPTMPQYEEQMVSTLQLLGPGHPLVADAQSNDPEVAARGIIGIFEIAKASATTVRATREKVQRDKRQQADSASAAAVVSSSSASPSSAEAPRPRVLGPGLTLEALEEAWDQ